MSEERRRRREKSGRQKACIKDRKPLWFSERSVLSERDTECGGKREGSRMGENTSGRNWIDKLVQPTRKLITTMAKPQRLSSTRMEWDTKACTHSLGIYKRDMRLTDTNNCTTAYAITHRRVRARTHAHPHQMYLGQAAAVAVSKRYWAADSSQKISHNPLDHQTQPNG